MRRRPLRRGLDPFAALRLPPDATLAEVHDAYARAQAAYRLLHTPGRLILARRRYPARTPRTLTPLGTAIRGSTEVRDLAIHAARRSLRECG